MSSVWPITTCTGRIATREPTFHLLDELLDPGFPTDGVKQSPANGTQLFTCIYYHVVTFHNTAARLRSAFTKASPSKAPYHRAEWH